MNWEFLREHSIEKLSNMVYKSFFNIVLMSLLVGLSSCYSFTGSSLSPEIKTINIHQFPNYAPLQNTTLSSEFSDALQLRFDQRTKLTLTNDDTADIVLEGEITGYNVVPTTVVSGDTAAQNRLTITVKVHYQNNVQMDKSFTRTFSEYADFDADESLEEVQDELTETINENLIDLIFNAVVSDW